MIQTLLLVLNNVAFKTYSAEIESSVLVNLRQFTKILDYVTVH
jgi:hypothetical protein